MRIIHSILLPKLPFDLFYRFRKVLEKLQALYGIGNFCQHLALIGFRSLLQIRFVKVHQFEITFALMHICTFLYNSIKLAIVEAKANVLFDMIVDAIGGS